MDSQLQQIADNFKNKKIEGKELEGTVLGEGDEGDLAVEPDKKLPITFIKTSSTERRPVQGDRVKVRIDKASGTTCFGTCVEILNKERAEETETTEETSKWDGNIPRKNQLCKDLVKVVPELTEDDFVNTAEGTLNYMTASGYLKILRHMGLYQEP